MLEIFGKLQIEEGNNEKRKMTGPGTSLLKIASHPFKKTFVVFIGFWDK